MQKSRLAGEGIMRTLGLIFFILLLSAPSVQSFAASDVVLSAASKTEQLIADTYVRLEALNTNGAEVGRYQMAKALALLDTARREHYMRNKSALVSEFIASSQEITSALESQRIGGVDNPIYTDSKPVAPTLWRRIEHLKAGSSFSCSGAMVAKAEVALLAAANDNYLLGWRAAVGRITMAEQWLSDAEHVGAC